jgi:serine/threonine protein kinase
VAQASRSTFGKYVLLRKLASGGMGEIFLAKQRGPSGFEKLLVIKRILSHHLDKKDYLDMFFSEAKLVARLNHHNIIQIHEMGEIDGDYYIAMEYVRGKSLRDLIDELRAEGEMLPLPHVIDLAIKLCEGLGYAHQARDIRGRPMNIVHRDINPHNVLISYTGDLKLIDFGIAKSEMTSVHTATGTIKGKFVYMSPEQSAADPIDRRSDIFSLGIVLYEMCCLENPFVRQNVVLSLEAIQRHDVAPPSAKRVDAGPMDDILMKALAKRPEDRYQSAIEMRDELRSLFSDGAVRPATTDLTTFLHTLFKGDIAEEDRLLAEADQATQPPEPSMAETVDQPHDPDLIDAPSSNAQLPFPDEEETIAGDLEGIAAKSRATSQDSAAHYEMTPEPMSAELYQPPSSSLPHGPTRSDRVPTRDDDVAIEEESSVAGSFLPPGPSHTPSGQEFPAPPMRSMQSAPSMVGPSPFDEPISSEMSNLAPTKELQRAQASSEEAGPLASSIPEYVTDEDSGVLQPRPPGANAGRFLLYALVLVVTTVAGFLVTRAIIAPKKETKRGVALLPLEGQPTPTKDEPDEPETPETTDVTPAGIDDGTDDPKAIDEPEDPEVPEAAIEDGEDDPPKKKKRKKRRKKRRRKKKRAVEKAPDVEDAPPPPPPPPPPAEKVVEAPPPPPPPARAGRIGTLTVRTNLPVSVEIGGRSVGTSPSALAVRKDTGKITLGGADLPYTVTLRYAVQDDGVAVQVESSPWSIVKRGGLSLGRTPREVSAASRHKLTFIRPGQERPFDVSLIWNPKN